jgi:hypothetical protein
MRNRPLQFGVNLNNREPLIALDYALRTGETRFPPWAPSLGTRASRGVALPSEARQSRYNRTVGPT